MIISPQDFFQKCLTLTSSYDEDLKKKLLKLSVNEKLLNECYFLDVREESHFNVMHIYGFLNVPLTMLSYYVEDDSPSIHFPVTFLLKIFFFYFFEISRKYIPFSYHKKKSIIVYAVKVKKLL
jgi:rhodanese-related sulfurtransferase